MDIKDFHELVIQANGGDDVGGMVVTRDQIVSHMRAVGYSERTIQNALTPSRHGGLINRLMAGGAIAKEVKRYRIIDADKLRDLAEYRRPRKKTVKMYSGNIPDASYKPHARLDDGGDVQWMLYSKDYDDGVNLKVVAMGAVAQKANYWLTAKCGRIVMTKDAGLLKEHRPEIFANLCEEIDEMGITQ